MILRALAALALSVLLLTLPRAARAEDGLFGSMFSRGVGADATKPPSGPQAVDRDREARDLRRAYWERERARQADAGRGLAREASSGAVVTR